MISSNTRDLLLFLQLVHVKGLIDPNSVTVKEPKLAAVGKEWLNHKSTQLSIKQNQLAAPSAPPTPAQLVDTYKQLLAENEECRNTTDLANKLYYKRMAEVDELIRKNKDEFTAELELNKLT